MGKIIIDGCTLTIEDVINVSRKFYHVELSQKAIEKMQESRKMVEMLVENKKVEYGITTGFGKFSDVVIPENDIRKLQKNLILSHSCGVGEPFDLETSRAIMLLRVNALAKGYSGIRVSTVQTLIEMLNKGVTPEIPQKGSLGASGDLTPLAHMVLVMLGEGEAYYKGEKMHGKEAMKKAGIETVTLVEKEGLALINGTQVMTAVGALAVYDALNLIKAADILASMSCEALRGITDAFYYKIQEVRPHPGQVKCARNLLRVMEGSALTTRQGELRVQDAYTLRCIPQVHGASRDAIEYAMKVIETEINSATDNPLIFVDEERIISGGNFHGQPVALAMDFIGIAVSELANISERRVERLVNYNLSSLPPFLTKNGGLNSGFMIAQYSAAALVSENKVLSHPASVDSIPSSANQEDHVSMGTIAARKARSIIYNTSRVLGIEYMTAGQAIYLRGDVEKGTGTGAAYMLLRQNIAPMDDDRIMYKDIETASNCVLSGIVTKSVEQVLGKLE